MRPRRRRPCRALRRNGRAGQLGRHRRGRYVRGAGHEEDRAPARREPPRDARDHARIAATPARLSWTGHHARVDRGHDSHAWARGLRRDESSAHRVDDVAEPRGGRARHPRDGDLTGIRRHANDRMDWTPGRGADLARRHRRARSCRALAQPDGACTEYRRRAARRQPTEPAAAFRERRSRARRPTRCPRSARRSSRSLRRGTSMAPSGASTPASSGCSRWPGRCPRTPRRG